MVRLTIRKKMVLEGLSEALHVSVEWLKGETDEYETDITDKRELQIRDAMGDILEQLPLALTKEEDAFSKDLIAADVKTIWSVFGFLPVRLQKLQGECWSDGYCQNNRV